MRKAETTKGVPILTFTHQWFVTLKVFTTAITDRLHTADRLETVDLSKTKATIILKYQLMQYGMQGQYPDGFFESSWEGEVYEHNYQLVKAWVSKNYPHLIEQSK